MPENRRLRIGFALSWLAACFWIWPGLWAEILGLLACALHFGALCALIGGAPRIEQGAAVALTVEAWIMIWTGLEKLQGGEPGLGLLALLGAVVSGGAALVAARTRWGS